MFVLPICFVDISIVKGFKNCRFSALSPSSRRSFSLNVSHVPTAMCMKPVFDRASFMPVAPSFVLNFLLNPPFLLLPLIVLPASLLRKC